MKIPLVASKPHTYAGKALRSGHEYSASDADAKVLVATGLAQYASRGGAAPKRKGDPKPKLPAEPAAARPAIAAPEAGGAELELLRTVYLERVGKKPHTFWREKRIRDELAAIEAAAAAKPAEKPAE